MVVFEVEVAARRWRGAGCGDVWGKIQNRHAQTWHDHPPTDNCPTCKERASISKPSRRDPENVSTLFFLRRACFPRGGDDGG